MQEWTPWVEIDLGERDGVSPHYLPSPIHHMQTNTAPAKDGWKRHIYTQMSKRKYFPIKYKNIY